ncbi:OprD family outer membrane porin [Pseudomonas typographi]|uniref:OprD family outer membrane porin n=1 Tax=Pseudomonas typographi TaxID=2715964 RepID=UPI00168455E3|nr:OprD family porin [Pseudomonas typographi]
MNKSTLALAVAMGVLAQQASAAGFIEDSKASISSRTLYFDNDAREGGADQRQTVTGLKFDFLSGYTQGTVGFGLDVQGMVGINLGGGIDHHSTTTANTVTPVDSDGTPVSDWSRLGGNAKIKYSKTELKVGNALAPNLPILVSNDGRLLPASYQGAIVTSKEIDNVTFTAGQLNREIGRASSNWAGIAAGGRKGSNAFRFGGADWKVTKDLTLQYYYAELEDYYRQNFLGLVHVFQIAPDQAFKTDLRYFNSKSDGKNGDADYSYKNGYYKDGGEVDNNTWSAAFTYTLGGHSLTLGHQRVSDDGGMAFLNNGSVVDGRGRGEGEGGTSVYLYTDIMYNNFTKAGENSTFGIYSYDFAKLGVPGLKATYTYVSGRDVRNTSGNGSYDEWEADYRVDYTLQSGPLKGLGFSARHATFRSEGVENFDQNRFYVNYTYALW